MSTPRDYFHALSEVDEANEAMKLLGRQLKSFTERMLSFPQETCFVGVEEPEPPLGQLIGGACWHATDFPTAERIQAVLRWRFESRQKALRIWDELTPYQRDGARKVPA